MAAVGAEVTGSWLLSSGVVSFFILLLVLSIFLAALCSDCGRRSFELQDSEEKNPSALIKVVKLEDTMVGRENPTIGEIQIDEKEFTHNEENPVLFTPWRNHLGAPQNNQDVTAPPPPDSSHICNRIGGGRGNSDLSSPPSNHEPAALDLSNRDGNSVYAQVSRKERQATPPVTTPEVAQGEELEEEESTPPLPDRNTEMEG